MDIGEPQRTKIVEPLVDPVPREAPAPAPERERTPLVEPEWEPVPT